MKTIYTIVSSFIILVLIWHLIIPSIVVFSFLPTFSTPPIDHITYPPEKQTITIHRQNIETPLDIYAPSQEPKRQLILFHAANEEGKDDPRLIRAASIFARAGFVVYAPTLQNLDRSRFHPNVIDEMKQVIIYAHEQHPELPTTVFTFSIGAGPVLIAVSDFTKQPERVTLLGGYHDLANLIRFQTTGYFINEDEELEKGEPLDPFGTWLFARYYAQFLPVHDAEIMREIAERKREDIHADISDLASRMRPDGLAALSLLTNTDPKKVDELIHALPPDLQVFLTSLDPVPHLENLNTQILLIHSKRDNIIPAAESKKLHQSLQNNDVNSTLILLSAFDHVNPVFPDPNIQNIFTIYIPEFLRLYRAVWLMMYG